MSALSQSLLFSLTAFALAACVGVQPIQTASVSTPQDKQLSCREILVVGSNQHQRLCGTDEQWARYDRYQAWSAQALTQKIQGSSFSGAY